VKFWIDGGSLSVVTFIMLLSALLTMGLVWLVDRLWTRDARRRHNDLAGYMISVVAVVYAVLLGFVTVTVWENYDKASASVGDEAVLIADIYRDVGVLPPSVAGAVRRDLVSYATAVIGEEWPKQMAGQQLRSTRSALDKVPQHLMEAATADPTTVVFLREIAERLNKLHDARRARVFATGRPVPSPIWMAVIAGSICIVGFSLSFGFYDLYVHMMMSSVLSASIALVLTVIVGLSSPFQGATAISSDPFKHTLEYMQASG
jgi:ABC-type multidrug transport system fused ATPase/permease subunit